MNQKKARALRKALGMTKENFRQKEYGAIKHPAKIVYFRNGTGDLVPTKAERVTIVNKNLNYYRRAKKELYKQGK